jgi:formylmethanofuran dehydrogenase subunit D
MLQDYKRQRHHISTQNLEALFFPKCEFSHPIVDPISGSTPAPQNHKRKRHHISTQNLDVTTTTSAMKKFYKSLVILVTLI